MNTENKKIILIGGFVETIELLINNDFQIAGIVDKSIESVSSHFRERFEYLGDDAKLILLVQEGKIKQLPMLLSPDQPALRERLYQFYENIDSKYVNLLSKKANVASSSNIEQKGSTIIQDFANISSNVSIGKCVHINTNANIMHDCILEDFVTIAPDAVLLGAVKIGKSSYIGANATILPGIEIGKNVIVGAGAVVTKNVEPNSVVAGVPARRIRLSSKN